jgi:hypothetical protein
MKKELQIKVEMIKVYKAIAQKKSYHGLPSQNNQRKVGATLYSNMYPLEGK